MIKEAKKVRKLGRPPTGRSRLDITLPEVIREQLAKVASEEQATMSEIIERLLRGYLQRRGKRIKAELRQ